MRLRTFLYGVLVSLLLVATAAQGQVVVPEFSTRGDVPREVVTRFMDAFRQQLAARTKLEVSAGSIFAPPPRGGVDPEVARAVADLAAERYGLTGEIIASRGALSEETAYTVNLLLVDTQTGARSDLISEPLSTRDYLGAVAELTGALGAFINPGSSLSSGSASLFISSQPRRAQIHIDGAYVGDTSEAGLISLAPGRYSVELRKDGFVPEIDTLTLEVNHTEFVNFELTPIRSGSVQKALSVSPPIAPTKNESSSATKRFCQPSITPKTAASFTSPKPIATGSSSPSCVSSGVLPKRSSTHQYTAPRTATAPAAAKLPLSAFVPR